VTVLPERSSCWVELHIRDINVEIGFSLYEGWISSTACLIISALFI